MDVAVPLISAAVAALVAWIVALYQGRAARENWVLDKRYALYETVITEALKLTDPVPQGENDRQRVFALIDSLSALDLIAPKVVKEMTAEVVGLIKKSTTAISESKAVFGALDRLIVLLHEDLVPKHMR